MPRHCAPRACWCWPAAALLGGCGVLNSFPPAPATVEAQDHRYKIGPLDTLNILVWRNPDLSATVSVRPDGRISSPLVEDLMAAGRSPVDLARDIEKTLAKFIREPVVTVVVGGFQGIYPEQIRIVGEAAKPQSVPYRQQMTILDVMIAAGGPDRLCRRQRRRAGARQRGRQAVQRAAQGPAQARRHLRQRGGQARGHRDRAPKLVLTRLF